MWTWYDSEHTAAVYIAEEEPSIFCGINAEPLASWLANGNTPEEFSMESQ